MSKIIQEKKAVLKFVCNFKNVVKKEDWVSRYDIDTDSFSVTTKRLPKDARIKYFGDEFAFYMTKDSKVKGIFIEYFKKNFVKHNKDIEDIKKLLVTIEAKREESGGLLEVKNNQLKQSMVSKLEESMEYSLAENIELDPVTS